MSEEGSHPQRSAFLAQQRWFAGKGRSFTITDVRVLDQVTDLVRVELVEVEYAEGEPASERYQMPVSTYAEPQEHLAHALVREGDGEWTYDALHDKDAMTDLLRAFVAERDGAVAFHRVAGHDLDVEARPTFFTGEQSNSSVIFGEDAMLKVYRKVHPGRNPDIELHRALTEAGSPHVAHLYGWMADAESDLAMLQQFLRTAADGWDLALTSVRNLFAEADLHADEVGGDFAAEAHRLGAAVAAVHAVLADLGTEPLDPAAVAAAMAERLRAGVGIVADLAPLAEALSARLERLAALGDGADLRAQRIHGDLHLGQTLRTSRGWKLVDFEGEPAKPLSERVLPDSPWRDVAGMVRSFHYAAESMARDREGSELDELQIGYRAKEWVRHNVSAFLQGYAEERGAPVTETEQALLDAYVLDKAVYEAGYEARNRPGWLPIPMAALRALAEDDREADR